MKLKDEIERVLINAMRPLTAYELSTELSYGSNNRRTARNEFSIYKVQSCLDNFPSTFQQLNGKAILVSDQKWRNFLLSYSYILNILRGFYSNAELQFFVGALFLSKRIFDSRDGNHYSIEIPKECAHFSDRSSKNEAFEKWLDFFSDIDRRNNFTINIFSEFKSLLQKIGPSNVTEVYSVMRAIDTTEFTTSEFRIAYEYLIEINITENYRSGLIRTPSHVIELMNKLLDPAQGSILDPTCGIGGLISGIRNKKKGITSITGLEVNYGVAQIAYMNMLIAGERYPDIRAKNCFDELNSKEKYDYIIGDLPLIGIQNRSNLADLERYANIALPKNGKGFSAILIFILSKLSSKGKAVITVSDSFLAAVSGSEGKVRNLLIEEDIIEAVISIPTNSLKPYTNGKASILVLNKSKPSYLIGKIKFIDAAKDQGRSKSLSFDTEKILSDYRTSEADIEQVQIVGMNETLASSTLQVSFYSNKFHEVNDLLRLGKAFLLGELVELKSGSPIIKKEDANYFEGTPYVKIENLEKDILNMRLSSEHLNHNFQDTSGYTRSLFSSEILLVARIGDHLKPTYFRPDKNLPEIVVHSNVIALQPKKYNNIDLEYLYYQLYSPFVLKQIEQKRKGSVMPTITLASLNGLVIPFMSVDLQKEFIASQKSNIIAQERERVNQRLRLIGVEEQVIQSESDIVSTLVHEMRPKLLSFNIFANKLLRIINESNAQQSTILETQPDQGDIEFDDVIEPQKQYTVLSVTQKLVQDSKQLNDVLTVVKDVMGFNLSQEDFVETELTEFISNYLNSKNGEIAGRFRCEVKGTQTFLSIHQRSFKHLIDQLLVNAHAHAFATTSPENKIVFSIKEGRSRQIVIIEYSNNGAPFVLSQKEYVSFFQKSKSSSGSGIGGNYVYRIVKAHRGELRVRENHRFGFFMTIEIPLNQKINE